MNIKNYLKGKDHIVTKAMIAISTIFAILILFKTGSVFGQLVKMKKAVKTSSQEITISPKQNEKVLAAARTIIDDLKKKNVFAPPAAKAKSIEQISGIFGDEALINGNWYKAGDKVQDAEIVSIEPTKVIVRVDGQEKSFMPIISKDSGSDQANKTGASSGESRGRTEGSDRIGRGPDRGDRGGFQMPSREEIDRIRNMPEEERRAYIRDRMERYRESRHN
jgi:hypothetical protein